MSQAIIIQGSRIPAGLGHDEDPAIAAVIVLASDLKSIAKENGYSLTDAQALDILESRGEDITDTLLNEWSSQLWQTLGSDIEQVASPASDGQQDEEYALTMTA
jgi:hypothetical protein